MVMIIMASKSSPMLEHMVSHGSEIKLLAGHGWPKEQSERVEQERTIGLQEKLNTNHLYLKLKVVHKL